MTHIGPLNGLPIACTLTPTAGKAQIDAFMAGHPGGIDTYESTGR